MFPCTVLGAHLGSSPEDAIHKLGQLPERTTLYPWHLLPRCFCDGDRRIFERDAVSLPYTSRLVCLSHLKQLRGVTGFRYLRSDDAQAIGAGDSLYIRSRFAWYGFGTRNRGNETPRQSRQLHPAGRLNKYPPGKAEGYLLASLSVNEIVRVEQTAYLRWQFLHGSHPLQLALDVLVELVLLLH